MLVTSTLTLLKHSKSFNNSSQRTTLRTTNQLHLHLSQLKLKKKKLQENNLFNTLKTLLPMLKATSAASKKLKTKQKRTPPLRKWASLVNQLSYSSIARLTLLRQAQSQAQRSKQRRISIKRCKSQQKALQLKVKVEQVLQRHLQTSLPRTRLLLFKT